MESNPSPQMSTGSSTNAGGQSQTGTLHAFTIDVEGFAESHVQSVNIAPGLLLPEVADREISRNLDVTLDLLAEHRTRATFFFLGRIGRTAPRLVRRVADAGHEIGCHSLHHIRVSGQAPESFRTDLVEAKARLEDAAGRHVDGFRAPFFSIGAQNRWAIDILREAGFRYDSSIVPTTVHDVCGMSGIPHTPFSWPNGLIEFPLPVIRIPGASLPIGGGGYFRLYPLWLTLSYYRRQARRGQGQAFYIHPYEIGPAAAQLEGLSPVRRFRYYVRLGQGRKRLGRLLRALSFAPMSQVLAVEKILPLPGKRDS